MLDKLTGDDTIMCKYKSADIDSESFDWNLYQMILKNIVSLKDYGSSARMDNLYRKFLNILGFEQYEYNPDIPYKLTYVDIDDFSADVNDDLEVFLGDYEIFMSYTHYMINPEMSDILLYQNVNGPVVCRRWLPKKILMEFMSLFIEENSNRNPSDISYLDVDNKEDIQGFYRFFILPYRKDKLSIVTIQSQGGQTMKEIKADDATVREVVIDEDKRNPIEVCNCNDCIHRRVCKYKDEIPEIGTLNGIDVSDAFTIQIQCRHYTNSGIKPNNLR
jgi:hypothetical protein